MIVKRFQILPDFLKQRIAHNASLQEKSNNTSKEKDNYGQVLRLASAVTIAFLLDKNDVCLNSQGYKNLFQSMVLHFDAEKKSCAEFDGLIVHFPREHWT